MLILQWYTGCIFIHILTGLCVTTHTCCISLYARVIYVFLYLLCGTLSYVRVLSGKGVYTIQWYEVTYCGACPKRSKPCIHQRIHHVKSTVRMYVIAICGSSNNTHVRIIPRNTLIWALLFWECFHTTRREVTTERCMYIYTMYAYIRTLTYMHVDMCTAWYTNNTSNGKVLLCTLYITYTVCGRVSFYKILFYAHVHPIGVHHHKVTHLYGLLLP